MELVHLGVELNVDAALDDEQELFGVAVRVRLLTGRSAGIELGGDHLEGVEGLRSEQRLAAEMAPHDRLTCLAAEHARSRQRVAREEIGHLDPERRGDALERRDAAVRAPALELA